MENKSSNRLIVNTLTEVFSYISVNMLLVIFFGMMIGILSLWVGSAYITSNLGKEVFQGIGAASFASSFIGLTLEVVWGRQRALLLKEEAQPMIEQMNGTVDRLEAVENRINAINQLGLKNCFESRSDAISVFYKYASDHLKGSEKNSDKCVECKGHIDIVSSSARGLIGFLDRDVTSIQQKWRDLIKDHPKKVRFLLTHPSFAYLRQPAEERDPGSIEMEILKTMMYLQQLLSPEVKNIRLYRGSPTTFLIRVGNKILLNSYPYGEMAMKSMCLELHSEESDGFAVAFAGMHFNHTWSFDNQPSKNIDGKDLVTVVRSLQDIIDAFGECRISYDKNKIRFTKSQVKELDKFWDETLLQVHNINKREDEKNIKTPFKNYVESKQLNYSDQLSEHEENNQLNIDTESKSNIEHVA